MAGEDLQRRTIYFCAALAGIILISSLTFVIVGCSVSTERFAILKELYQDVVQNVLLPMFTTIVVSALAFIFGKEIVSAVASRIRGSR